jgi:hypothetical protein
VSLLSILLVINVTSGFYMLSLQKIAIVGFALSLSGCMGANVVVDVPAGRSTVISSNYTYNTRTCVYGAVPKNRIIQAPRNGSAKVSSRQLAPAGASNPLCASARPIASIVVYTPRAGFRGQDKLVLETTSKVGANAGRENSVTTEVILNVK